MTPHNTLVQLRNALALNTEESSDFDLNAGVELPPNRVLRPCGVLLPLVESDHGFRLILTKRSSALKHHPGQIAFPGGKVDEGDDGPVGAALREAHEEIGLDPGNVEIIGSLPAHETVTSFSVTPVLARVKAYTRVLMRGQVLREARQAYPELKRQSSIHKRARHDKVVELSLPKAQVGPSIAVKVDNKCCGCREKREGLVLRRLCNYRLCKKGSAWVVPQKQNAGAFCLVL